MFYYKTMHGYESRDVKSTDPAMQEITWKEYDEAVAALEAELEAEAAEQQKAREAEAADLAAALSMLGYKEGS